MKPAKNFFAAASLTLAFALTGCDSLFPKAEKDLSRYYVLNVSSETSVAQKNLRPQIALSIMRVQIPSYLDRSEILERTTPNRLAISENDLWLEPLGKACTRVFTQNLARQLGTERLALDPALDAYRDALQIQTSILKFDGKLGGTVSLRARWRISGLEDGATLAAGESEFETKLSDATHESYVEGMSATLEKLAEEIADEIRKLK